MQPNYENMSREELVAELEAIHSALAFFVFDAEGRVLWVNEAGAAMAGERSEALVGEPFVERVVEADREAFLAHLADARAGGRKSAAEVRIRSGGGVLHTRIESATTDGSHRFPDAIRSAVTDVTEQKALEGQLQQAQRLEAMGRLAGGIAHDFNNILMGIMGHTEVLLMRLGPGDAARPSIEVIQRTAERAASLTQQLVAFSRKQLIAPKVLNLNALVTEVDRLLRRVIREDIDLVYVLRSDVGSVKADPGQLEQVLTNLVVNARDAMPRGGKLTVETCNVDVDEAFVARRVNARPGSYVRLSVSDTGTGIDPDTLTKIFEPFFTTKEQGKGTGLGLATVYGIVEQSGGFIDVTSEQGRGTSFCVYLPRVAAAAEKPARPQAELPRGDETILLVEDEDMVREPLCEMLRLSGYTVLEARHGGEALLTCERYSRPIHLMLTDVVMPQISGRELAQRLAPIRPEMRVLFMSGHTSDSVIRNGVLNAMLEFIQKPFTLEALSKRIRAVLDAPPRGADE